MTRTNRESKARLIALALVAALAMCAGLVRGPTDEDVLAEAVRDVAFGDAAVSHPAAQPAVHADQRPQAINVIESRSRSIPHLPTCLFPRVFRLSRGNFLHLPWVYQPSARDSATFPRR